MYKLKHHVISWFKRTTETDANIFPDCMPEEKMDFASLLFQKIDYLKNLVYNTFRNFWA